MQTNNQFQYIRPLAVANSTCTNVEPQTQYCTDDSYLGENSLHLAKLCSLTHSALSLALGNLFLFSCQISGFLVKLPWFSSVLHCHPSCLGLVYASSVYEEYHFQSLVPGTGRTSWWYKKHAVSCLSCSGHSFSDNTAK